MANNSLSVFNNDGLELVIDTITGEAFATVSGYARMASKDKSTISRRISSVASGTIKTAEVLISVGLRSVALIPADIVFEWAMKDNPGLAMAMGKAGATVYLHQLAGYKVESNPVVEPEVTYDKPDVNPADLQLLRIGLTSVDSALVDGFLLNELGKIRPELKPQIKEAQKLLAATNDIPEILLTPTVIGQQLGVSAVKVNKLLIELGLQVKNPMNNGGRGTKGMSSYVATTKGEQYSTMTMATGSNGDNTTYQHLKWRQSIVDILGEHI